MSKDAVRAADDPHSRAEVDLSDRASRDRWARALAVTPEALASAVKAVGPRVDKVKDYLTAGMAGHQQDA